MIQLDSRPLQDQLGCFGYFGFGSGIQLAALPRADDQRNQPLYCNQCPNATECWQRHRTRVKVLLPDLTALADELAEKYRGPAYIQKFAQMTNTPKDAVAEPYLVVMMGNMEDGTRVANSGPPADRGPGTLTWPLESLR
jgi:hypothetical protein